MVIVVPKCKCGGALARAESSAEWAVPLLQQMGYGKTDADEISREFERHRMGLRCDECSEKYVLVGQALFAIACACKALMVCRGGDTWLSCLWECDVCGLQRTTQELLAENMAYLVDARGGMVVQREARRGRQ